MPIQETFDLVFSISNEISSKGDPNKVVFLVGTHAELASEPGARQVSLEEVQKYAAIRKMRVREVEIKNYDEVERLFKDLTVCVIGKLALVESRAQGNNNIKLLNNMASDGFQKRYNKCC
jgi:hypothetical protein